MFNLADMLKTEVPINVTEESLTSVLLFQTEACHSLVLEGFNFEGLSAPTCLENSDSNIKGHIRDAQIEIILVELNKSTNISSDMERINHLLPNDASVIVIGSEDAISTIRHLKGMGYYYLFWPVSKQELIDFIRSVSNNRVTNNGLGKARQAKKIAVWGSKGGVGATILSAQIALQLSEQKKSSCLVVDHNFFGSNLDIIMGLSKFEKKQVQKGSLLHELDSAFALSLTQKTDAMLSVLALTSDELDERELKHYVGLVNKALEQQINFIIEDFSSSANCKQDIEYIAKSCDFVVLVVQPTIASLREAIKFKMYLESIKAAVRILIVLNYTMLEKRATVSLAEVEWKLKQHVDITCPFEIGIDKLLLTGKPLYEGKGEMAKSLRGLVSLLIGESIEDNGGLLQRFIQRS